MDVNAVADELTERLKQLGPEYYIHPNPPDAVTPPAVILSYPKSVDYDETYGRGMDKISDWEIVAVTGAVSLLTSRKRVMKLASGGSGGLKALLELPGYESFDDLRVSTASFDVFTMAGVDYISCTWLVDIWGTGKA
jgi:hypothetical protein